MAQTPPTHAPISDERLLLLNPDALQRVIKDLTATHPALYTDSAHHLTEIKTLKTKLPALLKGLKQNDPASRQQFLHYESQFKSILLRNPLLDFNKLMIIRRKEKSNLGLPANYNSNSSIASRGWDNEIATLSINKLQTEITTVFKPKNSEFIGDVDLHFNADKILFSMPNEKSRWSVFETELSSINPKALPLIDHPQVHNYDACYLPDGNIIFTSTAPFIGVPCVRGSSHVSNTYHLDRHDGKIRRLTFDQEHNWCPTVLNNGRVMYLRWEYSDIPHYVSRILFHMNPDGSNQTEYYGSNSYWPNAMFYARPIPGNSSKFVAIVGGHHGVARMGELVLFDPLQGRFEADGVIQKIPGYGKKVEPIILDRLVDKTWPKFLHPYPLSDKYFIVSAKPHPKSPWGIYLVDIFDNILLLKQLKGHALFEPIPLRKTATPPVIPSRIKEGEKTATLYIADIYEGPGLKNVPRGTIKKLRLVSYTFSYHGMGGQIDRVGLDGPWDIKRVLGTVPVEADGSALFKVPANVPISIQPLDGDGRAVALMRSWTTAMPGEFASCVGCHEPQNIAAPVTVNSAATKAPSDITPWYGPERGFSFAREVQPVLDRYCVGCHDGKPEKNIPDFSRRAPVEADVKKGSYKSGSKFLPSYIALRSYVRAPTIESDMHLLYPYEYHASTTELIQMLESGHHNIKLDREAWDRINTWIDLHSPAHGTWRELAGSKRVDQQSKMRRDMMKRYANLDYDEEFVMATTPDIKPIMPKKTADRPVDTRKIPGWPFDTQQARQLQDAAGPTTRVIKLDNGLKIEMVRIPVGKALLGNPKQLADIKKSFWMSRHEISNELFALFDPEHDSRIEQGDFLQFSIRERGHPVNTPKQPVCRVSQKEADQFCKWLSSRTGSAVKLPTEQQWEWACRAGSSNAFWYGRADRDFSKLENLADINLKRIETLGWGLPSGAVPEWKPAIATVNDGHRVSAPAGSYTANPWGLHDMHGNVAEWTSSTTANGKAIARGGSWYDRPKRATSDFQRLYQPWQRVFDVGFRIVIKEE